MSREACLDLPKIPAPDGELWTAESSLFLDFGGCEVSDLTKARMEFFGITDKGNNYLHVYDIDKAAWSQDDHHVSPNKRT